MKDPSVQFIEKNGHREWAIVPYPLYKHLMKDVEVLEEMAAYDEAVAADDGYRIPAEITFKIIEGCHPIKAWREYRGLSQVALAGKSKISKAYLSQIETGKRQGKLSVLSAICHALNIPLDVLTDEESQ